MLDDLCFIDERDLYLRTTTERLDRYGKLGIAGAFEAVFGEDCDCSDEVISVMAQFCLELGYLSLDRLLPEPEWRALVATARDRYRSSDVRRAEVIATLGLPSVEIGRVLCYVSEGTLSWAFFDFWERVNTYDDLEHKNFLRDQPEDPFLRDVRLPATSFGDGLVLTAYGSAIRWGPGWWLRDPDPDVGPDADPDLRMLLRQINDGDPSQSLGLRRP